MSLRSFVFALGCLVSVGACSAPPAAGDGWREVGGLDGGFIRFVEISKDRSQDGSVYKAAAQRLCGSQNCFQVGFFIEGDSVPAMSSRRLFFQQGGWGGYSPSAVYNGSDGEFTKWDCLKAGAKDAPLSALCGEGIKEQYDAVLALATRDGWTTGCKLPATQDRELVEKFASLPSQVARRDELMKAFEEMHTSALDGPDDPAACDYLRDKIEAGAREGRAVLNKALRAS